MSRTASPAVPPEGWTLAMFVYGTLMRGHANHRRFCAGALLIRTATIRGRLFHLPAGYPAVSVETVHVIARGSADLERDLGLLGRDAPLTGSIGTLAGPSADDLVHGEVIWFGDGASRMANIDRLEGFRPGGGLYDRVLVDAMIGTAPVRVWTYVQHRPVGTHLPAGRWSEPR